MAAPAGEAVLAPAHIAEGPPADHHVYNGILKLILLGDSMVGKSAIITRFCTGRFAFDGFPTLGVDFKDREFTVGPTNHARFRVRVWDTAGQERFRHVTKAFLRGAHGVLFVYDITQKSSFDAVVGWMNDIRQVGEDGCQAVLVGNKADLHQQRKVATASGEELAKKFNMEFFEISAADAQHQGIHEAFQTLTQEALLYRAQLPPDTSPPPALLTQKKSRLRECCS